MHGLCFSIGGAIGPAIGSYIALNSGINNMFYASSGFALLSIIIVANMKETLAKKQRFSPSMLRISRSDIIEVRALPAAIVTFFSYSAYGVILTLIPDWSQHLGIANKGLFFTAYTVASIAIRFVSGKVADKFGRIKVMFVGLLIITLSLLVLGWGDNIEGLIIGACIYGIGTGILSPALNAWTIDLSLPQYRGKAMATMYIALEAGIGGGALLAGYVYHDVLTRIPYIMYANACVTGIAIVYIVFWNAKKNRT